MGAIGFTMMFVETLGIVISGNNPYQGFSQSFKTSCVSSEVKIMGIIKAWRCVSKSTGVVSIIGTQHSSTARSTAARCAQGAGFNLTYMDFNSTRAAKYDTWISANPGRAWDEDYIKARIAEAQPAPEVQL